MTTMMSKYLQIKCRFLPQVRMNDRSFIQKDLCDSDYIIPEIQEQFYEGISPSTKKKQFSRAQILQNKPKTYQSAQKSQRFSLRKMFFQQSFIKKTLQKFVNLSQILQNKLRIMIQLLNSIQNVPQDIGYLPVLKMNHAILKIWQIVKLITCLFFMWWMPFKEAFITDKKLEIQESILLIIILIDILIQINKEIIVQGQLIKDRKIIISQYVKNHIAFDIVYLLIYCFIIFQLLTYQTLRIGEILFFALNLKKFQSVIQNYQESTANTNEKINLFVLILTVYILAHFMACIWYSVGINSLNYYNESWIIKLNLLDQSLFTQYCYSFYWAATTMATVGYGDITGQNLHEILCSSVLIFFSSGIFAFTINSIGLILNNINQSQSIYKRSLLLINQHMNNNEVSPNLQNKIRDYLKFYHKSSHSSHEKEVDSVIQQLSLNLREELINNIRRKAVTNNTFLLKYFSKQAQQILIQNLEHINYTPQEQIYEQMSNDDYSFYIIQKGFVNIVDKTSRKIIFKLQQGDCFGEIELLTENPRYSSAYSVGFTKILKISRSNFISIIKQDQKDFEQFHMLKDQIIFKLKSHIQCKVCFQNHIIYDCNKLFYKPNIERIIKKELFHKQERSDHIRKVEKSIFPLANIEYIQQRCENFRHDHNMEDEYTEENRSQNSSNSNNSKSKQQPQSVSQLKNFQSSDQSINLTKSNQQQDHKANENTKILYLGDKNTQTIRQSTKSQRKFSVKQQQNPILTQKQIPFQLSKTSSVGQLKQEELFLDFLFDKIKIFNTYFTQNNISNVILQLEKYYKKSQKEKSYTTPSNYRFFQLQKQKFFSSRHRIN
ncbi:hypothetical protein pb186bvf_017423 [Paramecium bursaria]